MIHVRESTGQSSAFAFLRNACEAVSKTLRGSPKTHPRLWLGIAALCACGTAWAAAKLMFDAGGATLLALLRDAGHQVGGGGLLGALGGALSGAWHSVFGGGNKPTFNSVGPGVQIGHPGSWRDATPGGEIGSNEFVKIPAESSVTITAGDGGTIDIRGRAIVPETWLEQTHDDPGWSVRISEAAQNGASYLVGDNPDSVLSRITGMTGGSRDPYEGHRGNIGGRA